ncbi:patatin-like phospholipase family protein [Prosthecomicrobium pneumaticum]|uniref:NTE family protein n=1 Tax=Prosthecomicrobium pneumaticum TaxID=81895 RepID=A0A7W9FL40_9HYPH|nr:patatin-like phospholipase family protein [Prosthecomicrobium pneumaticum]MBB5752114.1 NTE family protein [Prosthecomicrobium pneumaticum]
MSEDDEAPSHPPAERKAVPARTTGGPRVGLALGGGGARGLAHIVVLEAFDDLGIRPSIVAGSSIGAVIGAGCAAGMPASEIRAYVLELFRNRPEVLARLWKLRSRGALFGLGQIDPERTLDLFMPAGLPRDFADLIVPLEIVAADYYAGEAAIFSHGPLFPAIAASIAIPVLFRPVLRDGRVLLDGGLVNPLPFDRVAPHADITVAVDVVGAPAGTPPRVPGSIDLAFGSSQLLMHTITREKLRTAHAPDILVRPAIQPFQVLDFWKAPAILEAAEPVRAEVRAALERRLAAL